MKTIRILGQILRNFWGSLLADRKLELAKECYSLGLRLLSLMFSVVGAAREEIIDQLAKLLQDRKPEFSEIAAKSHAERVVSGLCEGLAFGVVKLVSGSVGLERLSQTFIALLKENPTTANQLVHISVELDHFDAFPRERTIRLYRALTKHPFAASVLRRLVWYHLYMYTVDYRLRQRVCQEFAIQLTPAMLNPATKRSKRR